MRYAIIFCLMLIPNVAFGVRIVDWGATDQTVNITIIDSATGVPETGVTSATSGLDLEYVRIGAAPVDLTESDLGSTSATHSDGGMIHLGGGRYRVDLPDAAFASGVAAVEIQGTCTDMIVIGETVQLSPSVNLALVNGSAAAAVTFEEGLNASGVYLTLYVDASAAGDADGRDKTNAYTTINAALAALDGDIGGTIYVAAGTYAENVVVSKSNVTIIGVTGATVNAGTGVSITINEDNVTLIGMEADATAGTDLSLGAVDGFRARGCTFANAISIGSALDTPDIQYTSVAGTYYPSVATMATAIKAKTDSLTFTVAGELDANVLSVEGADATDTLEQSANDGLVDNSYLETQLAAILVADIDDTAGSIGKVLADILADTNELQGDWVNTGRLDTIIDAIKAKTDSLTFTVAGQVDSNVLSVEGTAPSAGGLLDAADIEAAADAAIASYFGTAGSGLTGIPWNAAWDAEVESEVDDALQTDITAIKGVTDKLDTGLEADGATGYQWTTLALENGPGGGGGSDWTADEKTAMRAILGIPGSGTTPADPTTGILDTIRDRTPTTTAIANVELVFNTDFASAYDATNDRWNTTSSFTKADVRAALFTDAFDITTTSDGSAIGSILDSDTDASFDWDRANQAIDIAFTIFSAGASAAANGYNIINSGTHGNAALKTLIDNMQTDVDGLGTTLGAAGAGLTAVPWNASWDAEAQSEATDALNAYGPVKVDTAYDWTTGNGTVSTTIETP